LDPGISAPKFSNQIGTMHVARRFSHGKKKPHATSPERSRQTRASSKYGRRRKTKRDEIGKAGKKENGDSLIRIAVTGS
jgi:hypothetical protein